MRLGISQANLRLVAVVAILCLIGFSGPLWGQARQAALTGIVKDTQGAVVPGADITVTNDASGASVATVSNDVGIYRFDTLGFGVHTIECALPGFKTFEQAGVTLSRGVTARIDIVLEVGEVTERVTVTGEAPLLRTESTEGVSETVTNRQMNYLPNLSRYWDSFVTLSALISSNKGGIYQPAWGHSYHRVGGEGWVGFYMNGSGAGVGNAGISPSQGFFSEFVEEFQLVFNSFSSEYQGSYVTVITTKSGANDFHGSLNYFILDDGLNALPWGAASQQPFRETQWGFSAAGPIVKDRTHFYFAYQREFFKSFLPRFFTIPTSEMRSGDFSAAGLETIYDPDTHRPDPNNPGQFIRDPFPGNIIPASRLDPVGAAIASFWPNPNNPGAISGNLQTEGKISETNPQFNVRFDHRFNERHSLTLSWTRTDWTADNDSHYGRVGVMADGTNQKVDAWVGMETVNYTYVPNPNWVVELTYGNNTYEWGTKENPGYNIGLIDQLGLKSASGLRDLFPSVSAAGYQGFSGGTRNIIFPQGRHTFQQRAIRYAGRHVIKFGAETMQSYQDLTEWGGCCNLSFGEAPTAAWDVAPVAGTGNSIASLLLGHLDSASIGNNPSRQGRYSVPALYFEDQIKVADNFTFNIGARFESVSEHKIRTHEGQSYHHRLDQHAINPTSGTRGALLYGDLGQTRDAMQPPFRNIWPRAGFAWQPLGAGSKTVIRGAAGMFSDWTHHNEQPPCGAEGGRVGNFDSPDGGVTPAFLLRDGFPAVTGTGRTKGAGCGAVAQNADGTWTPNYGVTFIDDDDIKRARTIQANFGIQQEIPGQMVIDLVYMTLQGRHMGPETFQENQVHPSLWGPSTTQADRPFPQYTSVRRVVSNANTKFHAANIKVEKRYSNGLNFTSDYIFQKSLNNSGPWERYNGAQFAWRMRDMQHRWVTHWIYDLPWGPGRKWANSGPLGHIAGPWIVSGIYRVESGQWLDQTYNTDTTFGFIAGNQGVDVQGNPNLDVGQRTLARWFNTDAFSAPDPFRMGNAGRTLVEGPGFWNVDLALYRQFVLHEGVMAQFSAEFNNLFNHPYLLNPGVSLGSPSFGIINGKAGHRRIQLGFRISF